ncbi:MULTISPECIES: hypothetical protein [Bacillus]|uniref:hypothetical protein n=1 Tax=Bacillus TaxID=1386 RepID=UPI000278B659|nr:hypothetical protein [Bacillus mycoides]EJQ57211.1 hypothetical protein IEW_04806 [Bacillus mycoides]EJQ70371.1 hypothetical protein IEY_00525 [Bacillus mycoides]EJV61945.1 hypothetical protein IEU_04807 [Bacillus mycoides]ETT75602.1 hypothetical protein C174_18120 [Bacillus mycoides FSL H7-687]MCQ6534663.1 hypothetical protein [Bacillus mycoides]
MKLTLFTISNEQIKEQLSKLQTKVESLESIKEIQDKIIATKDSQIAFLNGQIANKIRSKSKLGTRKSAFTISQYSKLLNVVK